MLDTTDLDRAARLDTGGTRLYSSFDPSGGNDDFNHFAGPGSEAGWVTLVDLKGPGCVRRFWTTGLDMGHPFKLYFDGEKEPRVAGTIDELFGDRAPFVPPLARYQNNGWWSYVPLTFNKALRIEAKAPNVHPFWGPRKLFYQINVETYERGQAVETFPRQLSAQDQAALARAASAWTASVQPPSLDWSNSQPLTVEPGATASVLSVEGPAVVRELQLQVEPADPAGWSQRDREYLLQDAVLAVYYDGAAQPSIHVPVGDFFGNAWRARHYGSALLACGARGMTARWPLPFAKSLRVDILNGADRAIRVTCRATTTADRQPTHGYLHALWQRSGPFTGQPHPLAQFTGPGKFVGCFLGVTGEDNSWWILEGDESMWVDGESKPSWRGTGLEDYFNGSWYYRGAAFAAFHGIMDRSPFRVAQYRHHLVDPVNFKTSFRMDIERGDLDPAGVENGSRGYFQSVAFAYLATPSAVSPCPADRAQRRAPDDRYARQTFMLQLFELERMNNFEKASDLISEYLQTYPDAEENGVYSLRQIEYRRLLSQSVTAADLQPFLDGAHGAVAAEQAKALSWFYEQPNRALVGLNANGQARVTLDGKDVLAGDHPLNLFVAGVELTEGPHVLGCEATVRRGDPWVQFGARTHEGVAGTGPGTWQAQRPSATWNTGAPNPAGWKPTTMVNILRGTPDAPFIGSVPNAFVLLQSKLYSIRLDDWGYLQGTAYFRVDFAAPLTNWPGFAERVTGLDR